MANKTISIIIPLYNAESFIGKCIESLLEQSYTNWNAIIIDDGSTDNSYNKCLKYIGKDNRFSVIIKNNEGVSITRNRALDLCKGDYVFFLDADDYLLDRECLKKLVDLSEGNNLDYIRFEYRAVDANDKYLFNNSNKFLRKKFYYRAIEPVNYCSKVAMNEFFLCFSFFKNSIIQHNNIRFIEHCRMREDADFIIRYLYYCNNVMYIPEEFYAYRKHDSAATSKSNINKYDDDLKLVFDSLYNTFQTSNNKYFNIFLSKFLSLIAYENKKSKYKDYYNDIVDRFPIVNFKYRMYRNAGLIGKTYNYFEPLIHRIHKRILQIKNA